MMNEYIKRFIRHTKTGRDYQRNFITFVENQNNTYMYRRVDNSITNHYK